MSKLEKDTVAQAVTLTLHVYRHHTGNLLSVKLIFLSIWYLQGGQEVWWVFPISTAVGKGHITPWGSALSRTSPLTGNMACIRTLISD